MHFYAFVKIWRNAQNTRSTQKFKLYTELLATFPTFQLIFQEYESLYKDTRSEATVQ